MKPIHKFNNGQGATLCHQCNCIITTGFSNDLYCKSCLYIIQMEKEVHQNRSNLNK
jgi:hypothetical protein